MLFLPGVLKKLLDLNLYPEYKVLITPVTFDWCVHILLIPEKKIFDYRNGKNVVFVSTKCSELSFDNFKIEASDILFFLKQNINLYYKAMISSILAIMHSDEDSKDKLFEWFNEVNDLFYQDKDFTKSSVKRAINYYLSPFKQNVDDFLNYIKINNISEIKEFFIFNTPFLYLNYYHFICKQFLDNCKKGDITYSEDIVIELLNIDLVSKTHNIIYLTDKTFNSEILLGSIASRVLNEN